MQFSIYDACFSESAQSGRGAAAQYLLWDLHRHGVAEAKIPDSDIILATLVHPLQYKALAKLQKKYPAKKIISGGPASTSPYTIGKYCDAVCIGDGQQFIKTLIAKGLESALSLPNIWVDGQTRRVEIDYNFPWDLPPIQNESGAVTFWLGRGCKNKCMFCQTGWAYKYVENPNPDRLIPQIKAIQQKNYKITYCTNDANQHTFCHRLPPVQAGSYSIKYLKKEGLPPSRTVRIGVEGVSERLRSLVKKPISSDDLVKCTSWLNANKKEVRWFMIAGLPEETKEDWEKLKQDLLRWKRITPKGTLGVSFTAFCPDPATPLSITPLTDEYYSNWEDFREWFFGGVGWSNRIKLMQPQNPKTRMEKAIASMGLSESELRQGGNPGPNSRVIYPYEKAVKTLRGEF